MTGFLVLLRRDLTLALGRGGDTLTVLFFFMLTVSLFPFGVGPGDQLLARVASGIIWVIALLAALLGIERLFQADADDGSLDLLALGQAPFEMVVLARVLAHWLVTGLPIVALSPILGSMLALPASSLWPLAAAMALGTPCLSLLGAVGAALIVGARRGGVLLGLIVLPFFVPVLIFGVAAVEAPMAGQETGPFLLILGAFLLAALALCPWAAAAALRQSLQ